MFDAVDKIRGGDRVAAAEFITANAGRLRRRYRQKLGVVARRLCDSQDLLATIMRRFDRLVRDKVVTATSMGELWSLILTIGDHALIDKVRIMEKLRRVEGPDSKLAYELRCGFARAERVTSRQGQQQGFEMKLDQILRSIPDATNRQMLTMWLMGHTLEFIADDLGMTAVAVRQRWHRLRSHLRGEMEGGSRNA